MMKAVERCFGVRQVEEDEPLGDDGQDEDVAVCGGGRVSLARTRPSPRN